MPTLRPEVADRSLEEFPPAIPESGEVHLWWVDLGRPDAGRLAPALGPEEVVAAHNFRRPRDRDRYIVAHGALRSILGRYLGRRPAGLEFRYGPSGKPALREGTLHFNLAHAHDLAVCAIAQVDVGVDIERAHGQVEPEWLAAVCPSAGRALTALPRADRPAAFFRAWTRMEACVKAAGTTVDLGLARLETFLDCDGSGASSRSYQPLEGTSWRCHDLTPSAEYVGALAVSEEMNMRFTWWSGPGDERPGVPGSVRAFDSRHSAGPGGGVQ